MAKNPIIDMFKTDKNVKSANSLVQGGVGFDNPRENIDPHIKTKVINTREFIMPDGAVNNYVLTTDGTGFATWVSAGTLAGGDVSQVEFDNLSGASYAHFTDSSDPHGVSLTQTNLTTTNLSSTTFSMTTSPTNNFVLASNSAGRSSWVSASTLVGGGTVTSANLPLQISSGVLALNYITNLRLSGSNLETIQNITTTSSPTFSNLNLNNLGVINMSAGNINIVHTAGVITISGASPRLDVGVDDIIRGVEFLYGSTATFGGLIRLYTASDSDTTADFYSFLPIGEDLWIGPSNDVDAVILTADSNLYMSNVAGKIGLGIDPIDDLHIFRSTAQTTPQIFIEQDSTGDASIEFGIVGDSYIMGIDNSDGDRFKISYSGTQGSGVLGTNDRFIIESDGSITISGAMGLAVQGVAGTPLNVKSFGTGADNYGITLTRNANSNPAVKIWENGNGQLNLLDSSLNYDVELKADGRSQIVNGLSAGHLIASNGFTGAGIYTTWVISGGIIISAS